LEKYDRTSGLAGSPASVAPTVITSVADDGDPSQASEFSLPAATTMKRPAFMAAVQAAFKAEEYPPPRDKLATDGPPFFLCWPVAQSTPAITPALDPEP